jgi:hypothetical protein
MQAPTDLQAGTDQPGSAIHERAYPSWPGIPVLVVLCGDRGMQPTVNAGSLYH